MKQTLLLLSLLSISITNFSQALAPAKKRHHTYMDHSRAKHFTDQSKLIFKLGCRGC